MWRLLFIKRALIVRRSAYLQYGLLAVVAVLSLTHFYLGAAESLANLRAGQRRAQVPLGQDATGATLGRPLPEAKQAGLQAGDTLLSVNGRPLTGSFVLLEEVRRSAPGQGLRVTYRRKGAPAGAAPARAVIRLVPERPWPASAYAWTLGLLFLLVPLLCLLLGLYVVLARPLSAQAWMIFGIIAPLDTLFIDPNLVYSSLQLLIAFWATIAQTALPLCIMAFGIYFPERSDFDKRHPGIKWLFIVPLLASLPLALFTDYSDGFNVAAGAWLSAYRPLVRLQNVVAALAIAYFFFNLQPKLEKATGDARRRLRVLFTGSWVGLSPFLILVVIATLTRTALGEGVPQWLVIGASIMLLLFPLSLAYVVVVQRAVDVRLLVRQGTKYIFARGTLMILTSLLAAWMASSISGFLLHHDRRRPIDIAQVIGIVLIFYFFRLVLSKRIQRGIDQRFFREAYSTEQLLMELSDEARSFTEVAPLIGMVTERLGQTLHIERIAVFLRSGDTFRLQLATGAALLPGTAEVFLRPSASTSITTLATTKAPAVVYQDDPSSWLVEATDEERLALADLSTELLVPLPGRKQLAGVIALGPKRSEEPYTKSDQQLLQTVASQTGLALENAELLETLSAEVGQRERISREIEIAREVQERLFPQAYPVVAGVDMAGFCRPAQIVGGDYYDFFMLPAHEGRSPRLALALGDISGKGISASLLMASLRASLRSLASVQHGDIAELIGHVNGIVYESSTANRYATFFYAEYEVETRLLTYVNAGHNAPALLRGSETILLEATGTVVGLLPSARYDHGAIQLEVGDVLLAFTDGISEAMNDRDEEWGEERMIGSARRLLAGDCSASAERLLTCVFTKADAFTEGAPQHDDMTLLVCSLGVVAGVAAG